MNDKPIAYEIRCLDCHKITNLATYEGNRGWVCNACFKKNSKPIAKLLMTCLYCGEESVKRSNYCLTCKDYRRGTLKESYDFEKNTPKPYSWME